jgi:hypothetical protein
LTPAKENISRMIDEKTGISVWKLHWFNILKKLGVIT